MDAVLNLPPTGPSDYLRTLMERLCLSMSYEEAAKLTAEYFPVTKSTRCIQDLVETDSRDAADFYKQAEHPVITANETILVVQADGKGVPMVLESTPSDVSTPVAALPGRKKGGLKREGKKKMATLVAVATYAPLERTAEQIVCSLFDRKTYDLAPESHSFKRVWATMHGKEAAMAQSRTFVEQTEGAMIKDRLLLTDGEAALKKQIKEAYPEHTHVLDLMHALGYLWMAGDAHFGAGSQPARQWVRDATLQMLQGGAKSIVDELDGRVQSDTAASHYEPIEKAAWYLEGNLGSMHYDQYLAKGWPIATGMIEGACRHIVKDRCERSGQRWTMRGVEGMLRLRCVEENGDWAAYHNYRIAERHKRVYGRKPQPPSSRRKQTTLKYITKSSLAEAI